jgi:hypothetical protein
MKFRNFHAGRYSCALLLLTAACSNSTPLAPSIAAPTPVSPATNLIIKYQDQPVTLTVQNAVATQPGGTTYTFEVATDLGFANKVQTKDNVAEGSGSTSVRLDALAASKDYYWHVRAQSGGTTGVFGPTYKFTMGAAIVINSPVPIAPLTGSQTSLRPAFRVTNATKTGPAGPLTYRFEISNSANFSSVLITGVNSEGVNETGFVPSTDLPSGIGLFWRATAIDTTNGVSSTPSAVQSFTASQPSQAEVIAAQLGQPLWPGAVPTGTLGHATMGNDPGFGVGWAVQTFYSPVGGIYFQSPDIEMLRVFDLLDRGFDPVSAINWMNQNGYPTQALWYPPPEKAVIGFKWVYVSARGKQTVNGIWDVNISSG